VVHSGTTQGYFRPLFIYKSCDYTSSLKKHVFDEHAKKYKRWGLLLVQNIIEIKLKSIEGGSCCWCKKNNRNKDYRVEKVGIVVDVKAIT
jgi:hypothetical protein